MLKVIIIADGALRHFRLADNSTHCSQSIFEARFER